MNIGANQFNELSQMVSQLKKSYVLFRRILKLTVLSEGLLVLLIECIVK
jgi:hypothetical protein